MDNELSPEVSQQATPTEDVIEAEWYEVNTALPETDPTIIYLSTQPYRPHLDGQGAPFVPVYPKTDKTILDRLLTPWGIAGFLCLLTGNILLTWVQGSPRPQPVVQSSAISTRAEPSPARFQSGTFSPLGRQSLDVSELSSVKIPVYSTSSPVRLPPSVRIQSTGTAINPAILPNSLGSPPLTASAPLLIEPSTPTKRAAIAKVPSPPKPSLPTVPLVLQSRSLPTLPPPPPLPGSSLLTSVPSLSVPPVPSGQPADSPTTLSATNASSSTSASINPRRIQDQNPPQSFNQKTKEQLLNLANQLPSSTENPGIINQLRQEIQNNQGN